MPRSDPRPPLVCIVGPTGVGKSVVAMRLALQFHGEIVSADSRQIYRGMDIGTAKADHDDRRLVPHHLLDICAPDSDYSVHQFSADAEAAIFDIHSRGRLPLVVGGSGHYISALTQGLHPPTAPPDPVIRAELNRLIEDDGVEALAARLQELDPIAYAGIDHQNPRRLIRAIEVHMATGQSIRELESLQPVPWRPLVFGLRIERPVLAANIAARTRRMFSSGLMHEIRRLLAAGFGWSSALGRSIGYAEGLSYLFGRLSRDEAIEATTIATRQYARRQMTWFRNRETVQWFDVDDNLTDELIKAVERSLAASG
jgi:tRNA dimethylallyltransferase